MFNLIRLSLLSILISTSFIGTKSVFALSATSMTLCSDTGNLIAAAAGAAQGYCRFTPLKYQVAIYEMGVCTADPMTGTEFNSALCTATFTATDTTNGDVQDMVETLDGTISLTGTSSRPATGTYGFPYVIIGNTVTVRGEFENGGTTYYGLANGSVDTTGPSADLASALKTFGPSTACDGTYTGASASNGTIDAYLTDTALDKKGGVGDYNGSDGCTGITRLVGLMTLNTPITITNNTIEFKFIFNIRNFGSQFIETGGNNIPDLISQGPFGGFFETVESSPQ